METATDLQTKVLGGIVNLTPRAGLPFNWNGQLTNVGNTDVPYVTVSVLIDQACPPAVGFPSVPRPILADALGSSNAFIARDVFPGAKLDFSFAIKGCAARTFEYRIISGMQSIEGFLADAVAMAALLRQLALTSADVGGLPPELSNALADENSWDTYCVRSLADAGYLNCPPTVPLPPVAPQTEPVSVQLTLWIFNKLGISHGACRDLCVGGAVARDFEALQGFVGKMSEPTIVDKILFPVRFYSLLGTMQDSANTLKNCLVDICDNIHPPCGQASTAPDGTASGKTCPAQSKDPNELVGPVGFAEAAFIGIQQPSLYTVYFANETNATAYARQVCITNVFDPGLDLRSFRLGEIAFGNVTVTMPPNRAYYQTRLALAAPGSSNIVVDVTAGIDLQNRLAFWTLNAIDLTTGLLVTDRQQGILPPDDLSGAGEGHVIYTILPSASVPTGTIVTNQAFIVFDTNEPIPTNPTTNTVDSVPPTSTVLPLPAGTVSTNFTVNWVGADDAGGSGLFDFDVYVSDNGAPFQVWQSATLLSSAVFSGKYGHTYSFYSIAHDNAGNTEASAATAETSIYVSSNTPPTLQPIPDQTVNFTSALIVTNAATDPNGAGTALTYSLMDAPPGVSINPTNGVLVWHPLPFQGSTTNLITVGVTDHGVPPLSSSQSFLVRVGDYTALTLGHGVVAAGQMGLEPLYFSSSANVTNLVFSFGYDPTRLTNWNLTSFIAQATTGTVSVVAPSVVQINLSFGGGGQLFHGTQAVAQLTFQAVSNVHSAFVPLPIGQARVLDSTGRTLPDDLIQDGRIAVVGPEPLLEAQDS